MTENHESSIQFNIMQWSMGIPLLDDVYLGMQARNIPVVDFTFIRPLEQEAVRQYHERERTPTDLLIPLSAMSQMWIFAVYEFFRTWRQIANSLLTAHDELKALAPNEQELFIEQKIEHAKQKERYVNTAPVWHASRWENLRDSDFIDSIRQFRDKNEPVFRLTESLRVTLAKHEIPKTQGYVAEAPGYGRMDQLTGSMYWFVNFKDGSSIKVDRREIANLLFGLPDEREVIFDDIEEFE